MPHFAVSEHARQSQSSPSISLERGAYRMRAPPKRSTGSSSASPHTSNSSRTSKDSGPSLAYEGQMAMLVVFLVTATLTCFGAAYYLFTTRWATTPRNFANVLPSDDKLLPQVLDFHLELDPHDPATALWKDTGERFLAYLPHSGFHNQRIAFENALVLSRLLNRTLLVPPVRLGPKSLSYAPFDALYQTLANSGKDGLRYCLRLPQTLHASSDIQCADYFEYTYVPWEWLVDLSTIEAHQRLIPRWNMTHAWLQEKLLIDEHSTFALQDTVRDSYCFRDFVSFSNPSVRKYQQTVHLSTLAHRPERLIQLGSLFGSSRLHLRDPHHLTIRKLIRRDMVFTNPMLVRVAESIRDALGGHFLGAHIRLGDGTFEENADVNVRLAWWNLVHRILGYSVSDALALEQSYTSFHASDPTLLAPPPDISIDLDAEASIPPLLDFFNATTPLVCRNELHRDPKLSKLNTPLFISTDVSHPAHHPLIQLFTETFPCTFFLSDFASHTAPLDRLQSGYDGLMLRPFLEPLLDAMVVSRAMRVVGTEGSTFSQFVEDVLWRVDHGMDIVSRG